jgi:hypothetical protein
MENGTVTVSETTTNGIRTVTVTVTTNGEAFGLCELLERRQAIPALTETVERAVRAGLTEHARLGETFVKAGMAAVRERGRKEAGKAPNGRKAAPPEATN